MAKALHKCPYCETSYRHSSMANRCLRTPVCRLFNAPGGRLRHEWEIQAGTVTMALFMARPIEEQENGKVKEAASAIVKTCGLICDHLRETLPVGKIVADRQCERIYTTVSKVWGFGKAAMIVHLCEVVANLISDVTDYYRQRWAGGENPEGKRLWTSLEAQVDTVFDLMNPESVECEESWRTPEAYEALRQTIWGPDKQERTPSVYLANNRLWVVARGRAEARLCLLRELGLSRPRLSGMSTGTKLEDGTTVADLIPLATSVPAIVARTTA